MTEKGEFYFVEGVACPSCKWAHSYRYQDGEICERCGGIMRLAVVKRVCTDKETNRWATEFSRWRDKVTEEDSVRTAFVCEHCGAPNTGQ
jgi:ssDNA-binding Zn-finger/Zn-ribbon topoisomerase 1